MNANYKYFMCRLCLCRSETLTDIHGCKVESGYIAAALISDLLQLAVSVTDMYPQLVCSECLKKLIDFQIFKDSCWKAKYDGGMSMGENNGIPNETGDEYSNPCTEEYLDERNLISEIDIKEEPIEQPCIRDPLSLEPPYSDVGEIPKEDITIKEEEIQINQRLSVEEAPVTLIEKSGKIAVPQVNSSMYMEDTQGPLYMKQPDTSSTNGVDFNPNQVISKKLEETNLVKERNGLSHFNDAVSSSMFSFPLGYLFQLSLQGHIQSNNYIGMVAQNGGSNMHQIESRKECKSSLVKEILIRGRVRNSTVNGIELGRKERENMRMDGIVVEVEEGNGGSNKHQIERRKECKSSLVKEILVRGGVKNSTVNGIELGRKEKENMRMDGIVVEKNETKTTSVQYFCKECCKIFISTVELGNHRCKRLAVENFDCKEWGKKFKTEKMLWYHKRKHNFNLHLYCQICGKGFLREDDLSMHLCSNENNSPLQAFAASSPISSIPSGGTVIDVGQIQNNCDSEKEQVNNRQKKSKTVKPCPVCHRDYSCANSLKRHILEQHSEKNFQCNLCPKKFRSEKGAECHSRRHSKNRPYHCEFCGVGFYREFFMLKHISMHAKDEPFQCDRCGKKYNHKRPLWTHITRCYKRKSYECNICNKRFYCEAYLAVHKTIHTGEKNLMCEVCGKTFRGSSSLAVHRRQHTGEKPYCCVVCDRRFTQRVSLVTHNKRYHA